MHEIGEMELLCHYRSCTEHGPTALDKNSDARNFHLEARSKIYEARGEHREPPCDHGEPSCDKKWHIYHQDMMYLPTESDILSISKRHPLGAASVVAE